MLSVTLLLPFTDWLAMNLTNFDVMYFLQFNVSCSDSKVAIKLHVSDATVFQPKATMFVRTLPGASINASIIITLHITLYFSTSELFGKYSLLKNMGSQLLTLTPTVWSES